MKRIKTGSIGIAVLVSILLVLLIISGVWIYLSKSNKYIGLGETLRPYIQDTPILNLMLPDLPDDSTPALFARDELETKYVKYYNEAQTLSAKVEELESELAAKEDVSAKYQILLTEVDSLNKQIADAEKQKIIDAENAKNEELKSMVKVYETMDTAESAKIL